MAWYRYKLIASDGRPQGGVMELPFDNPLSAMTYLERQGGTVVYAQPLPYLLSLLFNGLQRLFQKKVTPDDLAEVLTNLAVMLRAGIPMVSALRDAFSHSDNRTVVKLGQELVLRVEGGSSLSAAAEAYSMFPRTVLFLMRVGEQSGNIDSTIADAAAHVRRMERIRKDVRRAMFYPAALFTAIFSALGFWLYAVVPAVTELFTQLQIDLPPITLFIIGLSDLLSERFGTVVIGIVAVISGIVLAVRRSLAVRTLWHRVLMKMPGFGGLMTTFNVAFITEYLALLLDAGVDMMSSLDTIGGALGNEVYRERLEVVRNELVQGRGVRSAFAASGVFPAFVTRMVGVGEESGTLTEQLRFVGDEYRERLIHLLASLSKIIEPVALFLGGGLFILVAAALFLPIYQIVSNLGMG